jgi:hypothetical protein
MGTIAFDPNARSGRMHSHDRTLAASLGFQDPDKGDPRHDLACQYLATPDVARKVVGAFVLPTLTRRAARHFRDDFRGKSWYEFDRLGIPQYELPVVKGAGDYRSVIGFVDLAIPLSLNSRAVGQVAQGREWDGNRQVLTRWEDIDEVFPHEAAVFVEVKVGPVPVGTILRQINLYRTFGPLGLPECDSSWVLATVSPYDSSDLAVLKSAGIHHVRLGEAFDAWCREKSSRAADDDADDSTSLLV